MNAMIEKGESNDSESQTDRKRLNYIILVNNQKCGNSYLIDKSYAFSFMVSVV